MSETTTPQRVQVYFNLHKKRLSIRDKATGKVIKHLPTIALTNCKFVVQPAGRERVRREGKKNVHAWVEGDLCSPSMGTPLDRAIVALERAKRVGTATYNPYVYETFVDKNTLLPLERADYVRLIGLGEIRRITYYQFKENR